jgi:hypothetical protein
VLGLAASLLPGVARAQVVDVEETVSGARTTLTFHVTWERSLRAALDSAGVYAVGPAELARIGAGLTEAEHLVRLPSTATPTARVVASESESEPVPLAARMSAGDFVPFDVRVEGIGWLRRQPAGSVVVPLFRYDAASGALHRYHRIVVEVTTAVPLGRTFGAASPADNPHLLVDRSALADGTVLRIPIATEGVYRLTRATLVAAGLDPDTVDPDGIRVYGNGGRPLPGLNSAERYGDLVENPISVTGGGDGRFDAADAVLFHAAGPTGWMLENGAWTHYVNPFSTHSAVFVRIAAPGGLRVAAEPFPGAAGLPVLTQVEGRYVLDVEERVWSKEHGSGLDWMSNTIRSGGTRDFLQGVVPAGLQGGTVRYESRVAIASNPRASVAFESGGVVLAQRQAPAITLQGPEFPSASVTIVPFTQEVPGGGSLNLTLRLLPQINEPEAALDWVRAFYPQALAASEGRLRFVTPLAVTGPMELRLSGFAGTPRVWDVTRPHAVRELTPSAEAGTWRVQVTREAGSPPVEIVAFEGSGVQDAPTGGMSVVPNQNLHGVPFHPDLVIVTAAPFLAAAEELADMRRAAGLDVLVATVDQVYNEFSGGIPDMRAARDFFKFFYDRAPDEASLLRYALLFGDGHYDFRGLATRDGVLGNWVFPYESEESIFTDGSFTSDDYFGLLDDEEGRWIYTTYGAVSTERVDIGVGRLPVQTPQEAQMIVDKIRRYESPETFGTWRSLYTFVADDGPTGLAGQQDDADLHLQNVDQVAELIRLSQYPDINIRKIYAESYERVFLNGFKVPDARRDILSSLGSGTLVINYSGHGGPEGLAQEEIFTREDARALTNRDRLAIFITATCSFGWWDLDDDQSGAEVLLLNPDGGAVSLLTTVRLVYTSGDTTSLNAGLNRALNIELFRTDPEGLPRRLGDVMRDTKNTRVGLQGNSRKFNLLGDPSMRIGLPPRDVEVLTLNGVALEGQAGRMRALDRVTITGRIPGPGGGADPSFDGQVTLTVFDATRNVPLVRQLRMPTPFYTIREDLIWRGDVQASGGEFEATFVVPKDISYSDRAGRISAYAANQEAHGIGFSEEFLVGGTSDTPPDDAEGPEVRLYLNDTTFVSGGMTGPDPELLVRLFDESGINTVGAGVGHEMLLVIDGDEGRARDIGAEFRSDAGSYQRGEVRWPLTGLEPGPHTLTVRAWDVVNNSATADLGFLLAEDEGLRLRNVYNYPNPMNRETRFVFEHNQVPGTPAEVDIRIYTLDGRPVRTIPAEEALPSGLLGAGPVQVSWDGRDDDHDRIATGIYLYRVRVQVDLADGRRQSAESIEKLAVIR